MNAFKRLGDIISSNINAALDKAENPEKMIDFSIRKLEDARCNIKKEIAAKSAELKSCKDKLEEENAAIDRWTVRAKAAIRKGMDDLAREAIQEKQEIERIAKEDQRVVSSLTSVLSSLNSTLSKIEEKLAEMKSRSTELKARATSAKERIKANKAIEKSIDAEWEKRIEELNCRIDKWEAEADITTPKTKKEPSFEDLEREEAIERELQSLKENCKDA